MERLRPKQALLRFSSHPMSLHALDLPWAKSRVQDLLEGFFFCRYTTGGTGLSMDKPRRCELIDAIEQRDPPNHLRLFSFSAAGLMRPLALLGPLIVVALTGSSIRTSWAEAAGSDQRTAEPLKQLSLAQLGNVEVTIGSKEPEQVWKTPAAVFVITQEDIRRSGATSLPEVLRLATGSRWHGSTPITGRWAFAGLERC
jgi:hypothetical protein